MNDLLDLNYPYCSSFKYLYIYMLAESVNYTVDKFRSCRLLCIFSYNVYQLLFFGGKSTSEIQQQMK